MCLRVCGNVCTSTNTWLKIICRCRCFVVVIVVVGKCGYVAMRACVCESVCVCIHVSILLCLQIVCRTSTLLCLNNWCCDIRQSQKLYQFNFVNLLMDLWETDQNFIYFFFDFGAGLPDAWHCDYSWKLLLNCWAAAWTRLRSPVPPFCVCLANLPGRSRATHILTWRQTLPGKVCRAAL